MLPDVRQVFPAPGTLLMFGFLDLGGGFGGGVVAGDVELAEDEEFFEGGEVVPDVVVETFAGAGKGEGDAGADALGLTGSFDGLLDVLTEFERMGCWRRRFMPRATHQLAGAWTRTGS